MKIRILFYLLILCFFSEKHMSQNIIYPTLPSDEITGLHFLDESELLIINKGGSIFKSYDGGFTWELKKHFQGESLVSIEFVDSKTGFVIPAKKNNFGSIGLIYTNDAGETWSLQPLSVSSIFDFLPFSEEICLKSTWDGTIERLNNFYNDWDTVYIMPKFTIEDLEFGEIDYSYGYISSLEKVSETEIIAVGNNQYAFEQNIIKDSLAFILKSTDMGITWDTLWIGLNNTISQLTFINSSIGWFVSDSDMYKTTDGGFTWQKIATNNSFKYINDIQAIDESVLYFTTGSGYWKSIDSGKTWSSYTFSINIQSFSKVNFLNPNYGFLYGKSLINIKDGYNTEIIHNPINDNIWSMSFVDSKVGIASGDAGIYKTIDGGKSWEQKFRYYLYGERGKVVLLNDSTGWCVSFMHIYKTDNLGETWTEVKLSEKPQLFNGVNFYNNNLGIIYNVEEEIIPNSRTYEDKYHYITIDGGNNWETVPIDSNYVNSSFKKVKFTDPEHLFGVNGNGLWLSRDTAKTWERIFDSGGFTGEYTFDFYDSLFGILSFSYSESFVTNDGGKIWKLFQKPIGNNPTYCEIIGPNIWNEQRVLECGENGNLLSYEFNANGDLTYSRQIITFTNESLYAMEVYVEDDFPNVWIAGSGYTVLYRQYEKIFTGSISELNSSPQKFLLSQNYPNPFNPTTTIRYSIPVGVALNSTTTHVQLKVYDVLGREVATLVNKEQNAGIYEVKFNASTSSATAHNLVSGIYYYRLHCGSFVESRKMILIK